MTRGKLTILSLLCIILVTSVSCRSRDTEEGTATFSEATGNLHAVHFRLTENEDFTLLEITDPWQGATGVSHKWFLVKAAKSACLTIPEGAHVIDVPVRSIVCMSATHVAMIAALGMESSIVAVSGTELIFNERVRGMIDSGKIREAGFDDNINRELLVKLDPSIIMAYGVGGESVSYYGKLSEMGMKVMFNADYLEPDPLGKAEWIKVFGALFCLEEKADSIFSEARLEYQAVSDKVAEAGVSSPDIMLGLPWKETWYISPGNSNISSLINNAGGNYMWKSVQSDYSVPTSLESIFLKAVDADFWLNPGAAASLDDIKSADRRLGSLEVFLRGNVYNNNRRSIPSGGNDYWETGTVRPGLILKDMAMIFNPALFIGDSLFFYRKLN